MGWSYEQSLDEFEDDQTNKKANPDLTSLTFDEQVHFVCIGKMLAVLSTYAECLVIMNDLDFEYNEKILSFVHALFEWQKWQKLNKNQLEAESQINFENKSYFNNQRNSNGSLNATHRNASNKSLMNETNTEETSKTLIYFEQYIYSYIKCIGNLTFTNEYSKLCFTKLNLLDNFLEYWNELKTLTT